MQSRCSIGISFLIQKLESLDPLCGGRTSDLGQEGPGPYLGSWYHSFSFFSGCCVQVPLPDTFPIPQPSSRVGGGGQGLSPLPSPGLLAPAPLLTSLAAAHTWLCGLLRPLSIIVPFSRKAWPHHLGHTALLMHSLDLWPKKFLKVASPLTSELNVSFTADLVHWLFNAA